MRSKKHNKKHRNWIFGLYFVFWPKHSIFFTKILVFDQFLTKIFRFCSKFWFLPKILIFAKNFDFCQKFWSLFNISILEPKFRFLNQNFNFWSKFLFWPKFLFLAKILIFYHKFSFLTKIFIFGENFVFYQITIFDLKYRLLIINYWSFISIFDHYLRPKIELLLFHSPKIKVIISGQIPKRPKVIGKSSRLFVNFREAH